MPVKVAGITDATAISLSRSSSGSSHSCALHQDGTISCWGSNYYSQLGNGTEEDSSVPVKVLGITDATAITTGEGKIGYTDYSCALHQGGTISCWGHNDDGQLGNGTEDKYVVPVEVVGITDATAISLGDDYSCALHQDGTISCWGDNEYDQLGNRRGRDLSVPGKLASIADATAITTSGWHTCALHQTGTISCWGNNYGVVPVQVAGISDATAITTSGDRDGDYEHSCALHQTGTISCWGNNYRGQLGNGQSGENADSSVPVQVEGITDATAISASGRHTCALHQTGTITCWGNNYGVVPVQVEGITDATAISLGDDYSCALHQDGTISCWGDNEYDQLGNRRGRDLSVPGKLASIADATAITTSGWHTCALHQTGTISCWGNNYSGQLGSNNGWIPQFVVGFEG